MGKHKTRAFHNGNGFTGEIRDEKIYESVKAGEADWKPAIKAQMTHVTIPMEVFYRLMELDKAADGKPDYSDT